MANETAICFAGNGRWKSSGSAAKTVAMLHLGSDFCTLPEGLFTEFVAIVAAKDSVEEAKLLRHGRAEGVSQKVFVAL